MKEKQIYTTVFGYICCICVFIFMQCLNYIQLVWQKIIVENNQDSNTELYNGAVEALYTLMGRYVSCSKFISLYIWNPTYSERELMNEKSMNSFIV
jgi:hypothetical protein